MVCGRLLQFWRKQIPHLELLLQSITEWHGKLPHVKEYALCNPGCISNSLATWASLLAFPLVLGILVGKTQKEESLYRHAAIWHQSCHLQHRITPLQINNSLVLRTSARHGELNYKETSNICVARDVHCPGRPLKLQGRAGPILGWSMNRAMGYIQEAWQFAQNHMSSITVVLWFHRLILWPHEGIFMTRW